MCGCQLVKWIFQCVCLWRAVCHFWCACVVEVPSRLGSRPLPVVGRVVVVVAAAVLFRLCCVVARSSPGIQDHCSSTM